MHMRVLLAALLTTLGLAAASPAISAEKIIIGEPVHGTGYLPLYVGIHKGFFAEEGLDVQTVTMLAAGAHRNATLTKQSWGFIGGPEHNAFVKAKGGELRSVVNIVNRGNVYFVARKGLTPPPFGKELADYLRGKTIATGGFGSTPNSITRYVLTTLGLNPQSDVVLQEIAPGNELASLQSKQADFAVTTEPFLTQGIQRGVWNEPFYNAPRELGPYAYSTINIRQESIATEPETVRKFVRAMSKALQFTLKNKEEALAVAKKEFPTMNVDDLMATINRSFEDKMWSEDGMVTPQAWDMGKKVVMTANILKEDVAYDAIINMSFMKEMTQ
ncbi:MAG: nitrate/sulfonate/bicarbonate transporter substrate-binding protein [Xanthobacteraceae bacterium]|nr:nitrate/sulfonate/bicarbonate transporter substrate-binding protein [Xanthobacteraceae bacterium]